jgi:hypothetical protein
MFLKIEDEQIITKADERRSDTVHIRLDEKR